jgi:hypothetical protein
MSLNEPGNSDFSFQIHYLDKIAEEKGLISLGKRKKQVAEAQHYDNHRRTQKNEKLSKNSINLDSPLYPVTAFCNMPFSDIILLFNGNYI